MASSSSCCRVLATTTRHFHPRPRPLPPPERYCLRIGDRDASSNQTLMLRLKTATHSCWRRRVTESEIEVESTSSSSSSDVSAEKLVPWEWGVLVSPFFFWGTAMVAMKQVLPKAGPFFVSSFRLIPAGLLIIAYAASRGRKQPSGFSAWLSIFLFALVDAACFQVCFSLLFLVCVVFGMENFVGIVWISFKKNESHCLQPTGKAIGYLNRLKCK